MPKLKPHELKEYRGTGMAKNAGPTRQNKNAEKIEEARANKSSFQKKPK